MIHDRLQADALTAYHGHVATGLPHLSARALAACWAARKHGGTISQGRDAIDNGLAREQRAHRGGRTDVGVF